MAAFFVDDARLNEVVDTSPPRLSLNAKVSDALNLICQPQLPDTANAGSCLCVVEQNRLVGLVTAAVILEQVSAGRSLATLAIADIMLPSPPSITLSQLTTLHSIISHPHFQAHPCLSITDDQGYWLGIVTSESIHTLLQTALQPNLPEPTLEMLPQADLEDVPQPEHLHLSSPNPLLDSLVSDDALSDADRQLLYYIVQFVSDPSHVEAVLTAFLQQMSCLRQSEATNKAILQALPDLLLQIDWQGRYTRILSQGTVNALPVPQEGMKASVYDVMPRDLAEQKMECVRQAIATGEPQFYEQRLCVSGREQFEEVYAAPLNDQEALVVVRDITSRKQQETERLEALAALKQSEIQNKALLMAIPDLMFCLNRDGEYVPNLGNERDFDLVASRVALGRQSIEGLVATEIAERHKQAVNRALDTNELQVYEQDVEIQGRSQYEEVRVVKSGDDTALVMIRDITDRKQAEIALREREAEFRSTFEQAAVGICHISLEGQFLLVNDRFCTIVGYSRFALQTLSCHDITFIEDLEATREHMGRLIDGHIQTFSLEKRYVRNDQSLAWVNATVSLLRHEDGRPKHFIAIIQDMGDRHRLELERRHAEEALRHSELTNRAIVQAIPDLLIRMDRHGYCNTMIGGTAINVMYPSLLAKSPTIWGILPPDLAKKRLYHAAQALENRELQVYEQQIEMSGRLLDEEVRIMPLDQDEVLVIVRDITQAKTIERDRAQAEEALKRLNQELESRVERRTAALRESRERFRQIFEQSPVGVAITDLDGRLLRVNASLCAIMGEDKEVLLRYSIQDLLELGQQPNQTKLSDLLEQTLQVVSFECQTTTATGEPLWLNVTSALIFNALGHPAEVVHLTEDITEKKQSAIEAQILRERLEFLLASSPAIIYTCEAESPYTPTFVSENVRAILGCTPEEWIGDATFDLRHIHPDDVESVMGALSRLPMTNQQRFEYRFLHKNGTYRWLLDEAKLIRDPQGQPLEIVGYCADITDLKEAEQKIQQKTEELNHFFSVALDLLCITDLDGSLRRLNLQWAKTLGYSMEEMEGRNFMDFVHPDDVQPTREAIAELSADRPIYNFVNRYLCVDGSYRWIEWRSTPYAGRIYAAARDITDRKNVDALLQRQLSAIEAAVDGIAILQNGVYTYINQAHLKLFGYTSTNELIGKSWRVLYASEELQRFDEEIWPVLSERGSWQGEAIAHRSNGTTFIEGLSLTLTDQDEIICVCRDITERKKSEEELRRINQRLTLTNAELDRATRLKSEFLANMSHELRTPLNAILGMSEGLLEEVFGDLSDRQQRALKTIERSGKHLLSLINDILDLSKVEAGKLELQLAPVSVSYLCKSSLTFVKQQALKKHIQISMHVPSDLPDIVVDERRIRQVLINLFSNAIKFTPEEGHVRLEVQREQDDSDKAMLRFSVIDTGIGIAPEDASKLFKPFVQIDSKLNRQHTGTGLGLALVRRLVEELHQGTIGVESELGQGSCFTFRLPYRTQLDAPSIPVQAIAPATASLAQPPIQPKPVAHGLIIEDSTIAAEQLARYFQELGIRTTVHTSGEGAFEQAVRLQPDFITLDLLLPSLSGWEVLSQLKANEQTASVPVVITSVMDEQKRGIDRGGSAYLVKPITRKLLKQTLTQLGLQVEKAEAMTLAPDAKTDAGLAMPSKASEADLAETKSLSGFPVGSMSQSESFPPSPPENLKILLAEDNPANVETVAGYLKSRGYTVIVANNGVEAIEMTQSEAPDLIVMDVQMPNVDGLEAIRQIRQQAEFMDVPIIALTALAMAGDRERCLAAGANEYLTKPVMLRQLVMTIQELL